jgi:HEAT repeat protein
MRGLFRRLKRNRGPSPAVEAAAWIKALSDPDDALRQTAADKLVGMGTEAVPQLLAATTNPHPGVRAGVAYALGKIGEPRALTPLVQLLQDPNQCVRSVAVPALRRLGSAEALPSLIEALHDEYESVRLQAAAALGELHDVQAVPALVQALQDPVPGVRVEAVTALTQIGDTRAVEAFVERLCTRGEHPRVQLGAVLGLGELGDYRVVNLLIGVLEQPDAVYRIAAAEALGKIGHPDAAPALIAALTDPEAKVREKAAWALGEAGDETALGPLKEALDDPVPAVRDAARASLERLAELGIERDRAPVQEAELPSGIRSLGTSRKGHYTYQQYEGSDAESARAFLRQLDSVTRIDDEDQYVTVETSEGVWGRDREGLFLVRLLPWQTDLSRAQCDGQITVKPTPASVRNALDDHEMDNVIATVTCGRCGHEWQDGIRYRDLTVVRCPRCRTMNRIDATRL